MDIQEDLRTHLRAVTLIAVSIIVSLLFYLGAEEFIRARFRPFHGFLALSDLRAVRYALFGLAVAVLILIRVLRPRLLRRAAGDDAKTVLHRIQRASLTTLVLAEVPGIVGLVLFVAAGLNVDFYILLFVSLVLVFMYFPRRSAWEEWLS
jgi:hypothetical protein